MKVLVTCTPMLGMIDEFMAPAAAQGFELVTAKVTQTLSERELIELLPQCAAYSKPPRPGGRKRR